MHADRRKFIGIDFSGAKNCHKKIWLTVGIRTKAALSVEAVVSLGELSAGIKSREDAYRELVGYISRQKDAIIGMDFTFSLPLDLMEGKEYGDFLSTFSKTYPDAETFLKSCKQKSGGMEKKRRCDIECKTPWSPYNLRLYRQTYYGISRVLQPLVAGKQVSVLPFFPPHPDQCVQSFFPVEIWMLSIHWLQWLPLPGQPPSLLDLLFRKKVYTARKDSFMYNRRNRNHAFFFMKKLILQHTQTNVCMSFRISAYLAGHICTKTRDRTYMNAPCAKNH